MNLKRAAQRKLRKSGGFTLVEMLIVVAIIVILVVVSIPMISGSLEDARQATDAANMRAAKSAAIIAYMNDSTKSQWYYDAANGTVKDSDSDIKGYNQAKQGADGSIAKENGVVKVTVDSNGTATAIWAAKTSTSPPADE